MAGVLLLVVVAGLDQWSKAAVIDAYYSARLPHDILPFFNFVLVHNRGISFGFLAGAGGESGMAIILTVMTSAVAFMLAVWLLRARNLPVAFALGCIIGGALGNIADRVRFGAVTDFLDFHIHNYHWPAFNVADSAIFIGVVILVLISIVGPAKEKES
jgi:signal peptidase II